MEKFLILGSVVSVSVFLAMFISHVLLLTKALQCSYDHRILLPSLNFNMPDNVTAADKKIVSSCRYGTFLEEDKFVEHVAGWNDQVEYDEYGDEEEENRRVVTIARL